MNGSDATPNGPADFSHNEMMSALFANMIVQQGNLALMMLGQVPHPQSGQTLQDLDAAKMFIDQLEMLEVKTKGNLSKDEEQLLKQTLTRLRLAFVEEVEKQSTDHSRPEPSPPPHAGGAQKTTPPAGEPAAPAATPPEAESRKKFTKKY